MVSITLPITIYMVIYYYVSPTVGVWGDMLISLLFASASAYIIHLSYSLLAHISAVTNPSLFIFDLKVPWKEPMI